MPIIVKVYTGSRSRGRHQKSPYQDQRLSGISSVTTTDSEVQKCPTQIYVY